MMPVLRAQGEHMNVLKKFLVLGLGAALAFPAVAVAEDEEEGGLGISLWRAETVGFYVGVPAEGDIEDISKAGFDLGYSTTVLFGPDEVDNETQAFGLYLGGGYSLPVYSHRNDQLYVRAGVAAAFPDEEGMYPWLVYAYYKKGFEQTSFTKIDGEVVDDLQAFAIGVATPTMFKYTFEYRLGGDDGVDSAVFMIGI